MKKQLLVVMSVLTLLAVAESKGRNQKLQSLLSKEHGEYIKDEENVTLIGRDGTTQSTIKLSVGDKVGFTVFAADGRYRATISVNPIFFKDTTKEDVEPASTNWDKTMRFHGSGYKYKVFTLRRSLLPKIGSTITISAQSSLNPSKTTSQKKVITKVWALPK